MPRPSWPPAASTWRRSASSAVASPPTKNLVALGQTQGAGNLVVPLVRPQEAVAAVQTLAQAYIDYYGRSPTPIAPSSGFTAPWASPPSADHVGRMPTLNRRAAAGTPPNGDSPSTPRLDAVTLPVPRQLDDALP